MGTRGRLLCTALWPNAVQVGIRIPDYEDNDDDDHNNDNINNNNNNNDDDLLQPLLQLLP